MLQAATAESDNPDVRDRAYVYWRLLSNTTEPDAAKNVVLSQKPPITTTIHSLPSALLDQLLEEMSTLASVYHKAPEQFVGQGRFGADAVQRAAIEYVSLLLLKFLPLAKTPPGNNYKTHARIHWLRRPLLPLSRALILRHRPRTMLKISSISISMDQLLHLHKRSHQAAYLALKAWLEHPLGSPRPRQAMSLQRAVI